MQSDEQLLDMLLAGWPGSLSRARVCRGCQQ